MIGSVGHIRAFAAFAATTAVTLPMLKASPEPVFWFTGSLPAVLAIHKGWCMIRRKASVRTGRDTEVPATSPAALRSRRCRNSAIRLVEYVLFREP